MRPRRKIRPLWYETYTITKEVGENVFELWIPPFLGPHLVFNVDLLHPYFLPLLDTLDVEDQLAPIELNPNYLEQDIVDRIMDTHAKETH